MIICVENLIEYTKKLLQPLCEVEEDKKQYAKINCFYKLTRKNQKQKNFLKCHLKEHQKYEIFRINLTEICQIFHTKNDHILLREIEA